MSLSRREWLASMLGAPLVATLAATGCDAPVTRRRELAGALRGPSMEHGHLLRNAATTSAEAQSAASGPLHDVLVLGGGPSGLSAAWELLRRGVRDVRVLELEREAGGTSAFGTSAVTNYPWGAHYLPSPFRENADLIALLREMGVVTGLSSDGDPVVDEACLVREPDERHFYRGFWYAGLYPYAGASPEDIAQLERFKRRMGEFAALRDARGRRAFAVPVDESSDDSETTQLDRMSADAWLRRESFTSPRLRWLCEYACRDDFGMGLMTTSAWALVHYYAARMRDATSEAQDLITWPEGNGAIVKHLTRAVGDRIASSF
ncbi:MAG: FAD-dependent oxidoreductase [Sandaracinaceae bacterium]|nr:FAD-dependent oxidoreductase [Sandaracinaceae bacterium]